MLAAALGGEVAPAAKPEWGYCPVNITVPGQTDVMLAGIAWSSPQFQCHFKEVSRAPEGAVVLASSPACKVQAFRVGQRSYGFQYHFEYTRGQIEGFGRDARCQKEMAEAGLTASDLAKQIGEHHETFERLGERLCRNIAMLMFPVSRKLRG
jgi:GMP synthase-like glutamine amidotransferase